MQQRMVGWAVVIGVFVAVSGAALGADQRGAGVVPAAGGGPSVALEPVRGEYCHHMGDGERPADAKRTAEARAREQAVASYRVYVASATTVKNFQLEQDVIATLSGGLLEQSRTVFTEKGREFCAAVTATLNPARVEEVMRQQIMAKEVAQQAQQALFAGDSAFRVRLWTNKPSGYFVDGEQLIVSLQSERDGYLMLDYYQADGSVVHLVPNDWRPDATIKAGRIYTFGDGVKERFPIQGPAFGTETIKAVVSTQPFAPGLTATRSLDRSREYLEAVRSATRDLTAVGRGPEVGEAAVTVVTASREAQTQACVLAASRGVGVQRAC